MITRKQVVLSMSSEVVAQIVKLSFRGGGLKTRIILTHTCMCFVLYSTLARRERKKEPRSSAAPPEIFFFSVVILKTIGICQYTLTLVFSSLYWKLLHLHWQNSRSILAITLKCLRRWGSTSGYLGTMESSLHCQ